MGNDFQDFFGKIFAVLMLCVSKETPWCKGLTWLKFKNKSSSNHQQLNLNRNAQLLPDFWNHHIKRETFIYLVKLQASSCSANIAVSSCMTMYICVIFAKFGVDRDNKMCSNVMMRYFSSLSSLPAAEVL